MRDLIDNEILTETRSNSVVNLIITRLNHLIFKLMLILMPILI